MNIEGKMQPTSGNSILMGALAAISSARWRRSMRSCSDWIWSTLLIDDAELLGLDDRADEVGQRGHVGAADHVAERVPAGLADADLGERAAELVGERALRLLDDLAQRGVEAEAGPDRDGQQVEGVRDGQQDGLAALLDAPAEPEVGREEADGTATATPRGSRRPGSAHAGPKSRKLRPPATERRRPP